jgi:hypothetical protein
VFTELYRPIRAVSNLAPAHLVTETAAMNFAASEQGLALNNPFAAGAITTGRQVSQIATRFL